MKKITMMVGFFAVMIMLNALSAQACGVNKGGEGSSGSSEAGAASES